jgi:DNA-directed RNA polymerase subunit RPC12/RpoP
MEVTCWRCGAVYDPAATGRRCPHCGHHSESWLAKMRFAAIDFAGPVIILCLGLDQLRSDTVFSALFIVGSLGWAAFIYFQDIEDWIDNPNTIQSKPAMPESWKNLAAMLDRRERQSSSASNASGALPEGPPSGQPQLNQGQLVLGALIVGLIIYVALRRQEIEGLLRHGNLSLSTFIFPAVVLCLIALVVLQSRHDDQILREGVLTPGILTGWYDRSYYSRSGYHSHIWIRYQFWTDSGQKFDKSRRGTAAAATSRIQRRCSCRDRPVPGCPRWAPAKTRSVRSRAWPALWGLPW